MAARTRRAPDELARPAMTVVKEGRTIKSIMAPSFAVLGVEREVRASNHSNARPVA